MLSAEWGKNLKHRYRSLVELFGPYEEVLQPSHPLGYLIGIDQENVRRAAYKTDQSVRLVKSDNPEWLKSKSNIVVSNNKVEASATLSEIRAYGDLLTVWGKEQACANPNGADFAIQIGTEKITFEVHTPQGRSERTRVSRQVESIRDENVVMSVSEFAPFGLPEGTVPTGQAECVSWISSIKGHKSHQFSESEISILWLDFNDPGIWPIPMDSDQALPVISWREKLTSGCFWSAYYAEKNDAVFDSLDVTGMSPTPYKMEFTGRFNRDTRIDFVVIDTLSDKIVFQNHKGVKPIPDQLFRDFFRLPLFSVKYSWLDWPVRGSLARRVTLARQEIEKFSTIFKIY